MRRALSQFGISLPCFGRLFGWFVSFEELARVVLATLLALSGLSLPSFAQTRLASIFNDDMVLQRDRPIIIWGWDAPGAQVSAKFGTVSGRTRASEDSSWSLTLPAMAAGGPHELVIVGSETIRRKNILLGEVWLCSGQSNMEFRLDRSDGGDDAIAVSDDPFLRLCTIPRALADTPQRHGEARWAVAGPKAAATFSAAAYWFGKMLRDSLRIPIGLVHASWGGTAAESWMPREVLETHPSFRSIIDRWEEGLRTFPEKQAEYLKRKAELDAQWSKDSSVNAAAHRAPPARPQAPRGPGSRDTPSGQWNAMIHPLLQFSIRGVIWYQGEANASRASQYRELFPALIEAWRAGWNDPDMPFYYVQLPNLRRGQDIRKEGWPSLRDVQRTTLSVPHTGMAVTIDVGDPLDLHPRNKRPIGERLARLALSHTYGWTSVVRCGPLYAGHRIEQDKFVVGFTEIAGGLRLRSGDRLTGFLIAAVDQVFRPAQARIDRDSVVVWHPDIQEPVAVRYAWAEDPDWSLMNTAELPASPFRTDSWHEVTFGPP